ncbi:GNAT family N-acetyltransferase [Polymorphospora rubra]|uniref:N-acetyltransferase domain-containing protein n=1 Tax=Polymorphospora rubra TaxID=338584 RepID=A0A810MYM9_9ACTN|nr:GNAT family N-acetyltransferase [Polymorphospora rubra]BCJ65069.1 hypothetical protein Prubr_20900 [Polymorphospora rubra]
MDLILIEKRRQPSDDREFWFLFEYSNEFNSDWWNSHDLRVGAWAFLEIRDGDIEVARIHLRAEVPIGHYAGTPQLGAAALGIQFIEVAESRRGQGIGTKAVQMLVERYPGRRLVAFSEADRFWASLGWRRYDHSDGADRFQAVFIQPELGA